MLYESMLDFVKIFTKEECQQTMYEYFECFISNMRIIMEVIGGLQMVQAVNTNCKQSKIRILRSQIPSVSVMSICLKYVPLYAEKLQMRSFKSVKTRFQQSFPLFSEDIKDQVICLLMMKNREDNVFTMLPLEIIGQIIDHITQKPFKSYRKCFNCKKGYDVKRCGKCKIEFFCGSDCQRKSYNKHKHVCRDDYLVGDIANNKIDIQSPSPIIYKKDYKYRDLYRSRYGDSKDRDCALAYGMYQLFKKMK